MRREPAKWRPHKAQSTDARHRGGLVRSSDEGAVMALERRGEPVRSADRDQPQSGMNHGQATKPFNISKRAVWTAWKRVKANGGAAGIDGQSLMDFEADLRGQLYKLALAHRPGAISGRHPGTPYARHAARWRGLAVTG